VKFNVELLSESFLCSELTVKHYKEILKCSYGDEPDVHSFVNTITEVLADITNKSPEYFLNCGVVDIFLLLLKAKINSQGESCKISIMKDDKQMNLELRFDYVYDDIKEWFSPFLNKNLTLDSVEVTFGSPTIKMLIEEKCDDEIVYFIKGCKIIGKHDKLLTPQNLKESKLLFESLPPKLAADLYSHFNSFAKELSTKNLLSRYPMIGDEQKLMFSPSIESLIWFTKLMFNEPLDGFYDNLFYLTNLGHFSTDYIERCTPGEYIYFTKKLEYTLSKQNPSPENQTNEDELLVE
jgi:hypothetical protein